jgi:hypothetical protein
MKHRQVTPPPPKNLFIRGDFIRGNRAPSEQSEDATLRIGSPSEYGVVDSDDEESEVDSVDVLVAETGAGEQDVAAEVAQRRDRIKGRSLAYSIYNNFHANLEALNSNSGDFIYSDEYNYEIFEDLEYYLESDYICYIDLPLEELLVEWAEAQGVLKDDEQIMLDKFDEIFDIDSELLSEKQKKQQLLYLSEGLSVNMAEGGGKRGDI